MTKLNEVWFDILYYNYSKGVWTKSRLQRLEGNIALVPKLAWLRHGDTSFSPAFNSSKLTVTGDIDILEKEKSNVQSKSTANII